MNATDAKSLWDQKLCVWRPAKIQHFPDVARWAALQARLAYNDRDPEFLGGRCPLLQLVIFDDERGYKCMPFSERMGEACWPEEVS